MKVYQIEISNLCNLTCGYCPHPTQERHKGLMSAETFVKAIELVHRCGQKRAYLHNFGEPLLHPLIFEFIKHASAKGVLVSFYTNGLLLDEAVAERLYAAGLREICISEHKAGEIDRIQLLLRRHSIPIKIADMFRPSKRTLHTWADQVSSLTNNTSPKWKVHSPCVFEREKAVVILWDGRVNICCIDTEGAGARGTVDDYLANPDCYHFQPIPLCHNCDLMRGEEDLS